MADKNGGSMPPFFFHAGVSNHIGITNPPKVTALGGRKNPETGTIEPVIGSTESTEMKANKTPWT